MSGCPQGDPLNRIAIIFHYPVPLELIEDFCWINLCGAKTHFYTPDYITYRLTAVRALADVYRIQWRISQTSLNKRKWHNDSMTSLHSDFDWKRKTENAQQSQLKPARVANRSQPIDRIQLNAIVGRVITLILSPPSKHLRSGLSLAFCMNNMLMCMLHKIAIYWLQIQLFSVTDQTNLKACATTLEVLGRNWNLAWWKLAILSGDKRWTIAVISLENKFKCQGVESCGTKVLVWERIQVEKALSKSPILIFSCICSELGIASKS